MDFLSFAADGKDSVEFRVKEWISAYQEIRMQIISISGYQGKAT